MTGIFATLFNVYAISSCYIGLPNRSQTMANFEGSVKLGPKLTLHYVLYIPNLKCNLISVYRNILRIRMLYWTILSCKQLKWVTRSMGCNIFHIILK